MGPIFLPPQTTSDLYFELPRPCGTILVTVSGDDSSLTHASLTMQRICIHTSVGGARVCVLTFPLIYQIFSGRDVR